MRVSFPCCDRCVHADAVSETTAPFRGPSGFAAEVAFNKSEADNCFVESCKMIGVAGASDSAMFSVFIFVSDMNFWMLRVRVWSVKLTKLYTAPINVLAASSCASETIFPRKCASSHCAKPRTRLIDTFLTWDAQTR